jgi:hypothetical protein
LGGIAVANLNEEKIAVGKLFDWLDNKGNEKMPTHAISTKNHRCCLRFAAARKALKHAKNLPLLHPQSV